MLLTGNKEFMNSAVVATVSCKSDSWYQDRLLNYYRTLQLLSQDRWIPALVPYQYYLASVTTADVGRFLRELESHQKKNRLVASFLPSLGEKAWEGFFHELPKIATFALCLERLTFLTSQHDGLLEQLANHFRKARKRNLSFFLWLKIHSIERPMLQIFVRKTRKISKWYFRWALITNILEATVADLCKGYPSNALVGLKLSIWLMRHAEIQRRGHIVTCAPENASEWVDLYQSWNMAFVSQAPEFPYIMCKLMIPSVADYHDHPEEYIYRRVIALYLFCNAAAFGYDKGDIDWSDRKLTRKWGSHNLKQSKKT